MTKPYLFIVNPHSGSPSHRTPTSMIDLIEKKMQSFGLVSQCIVTEKKGHAADITRNAVNSRSWEAIVAVGGDGTINEVAQNMLHTGVPLGIIPAGSGNGLARHLHIPIAVEAALKRLTEGSRINIDSGTFNEFRFFCTAGIGFDAAVSHGFASSQERGLKNYARFSLDTYKTYQPVPVTIETETVETFLLTVANAGQFGNNAWIAPQASTTDGLLDLCWVRPFPDWYSMVFGARLFAKTLQPSEYVSYRSFDELSINTSYPAKAHIDGEPVCIETGPIHVKCIPKSLTVIC